MEEGGSGSSDPLVARLLEPALRFAVSAAHELPGDCEHQPSPCDDWTVGEVAAHLIESLECLTASLALGVFPPAPGAASLTWGMAGFGAHLELAARDLLDVVRRRRSAGTSVDGLSLDRRFVLIVASIEASVHSWDLLAGAGLPQPIPGPLARNLQRVGHEVVNPRTRAGAFAALIPVPDSASDSDRLLAALGRSPRWPGR